MRVCGVEASGLPHSSLVSLDSRSISYSVYPSAINILYNTLCLVATTSLAKYTNMLQLYQRLGPHQTAETQERLEERLRNGSETAALTVHDVLAPT